MTSELKPCAGCSGYDCDDGCAYPGVAEEIASNTRTNSDQTAKIGESVALCDPDNDPNNGTNCGKVLELVRYKHDRYSIGKCIGGEYVRYDQAIMLVLQMCARWEQSETDKVGMLEHINELKAELAQIKDQKPDEDLIEKVASILFHHELEADDTRETAKLIVNTLYAAPVASAETIERFREALQMIEAGHGCPSALARHALSGKEPS